MKFCRLLFLAMAFPILLLSSPIQTDYAIFLFDNGDKNMIASMLKYAEENDKSTMDSVDFRIIFMGASLDAMRTEPFCHYPEKMVHYKQLGIDETIDHQWKRDKQLSAESLRQLEKNLAVKKKIWVGVSCSIFEQIIQQYQKNIEVVALRDNPSPDGDTDYFRIADAVQNAAHTVAVPSKAVSTKLASPNKKLVVIGQPPIEEWQQQAESIDKDAILKKLGLNPKLPIIVYAGVYGDFYAACFEKFLDSVADTHVQVLIAPHPRYKGVVEKQLLEARKANCPQCTIIGEFVDDPSKKIKTVEAIAIADLVVTADATSTVVFQANALRKKVLYINTAFSEVSKSLCEKKLLQRIANREEFLYAVHSLAKENAPEGQDVFTLLGIPKQGAKLLWIEFLK
jgi:hypothetical protein